MGAEEGILLLLDLFFPRRCPVCDNIIKRKEKICRKCEKELKYVKEPYCMRCGKPIMAKEQEYCRECMGKEFHYIRGFALWIYEGAARQSVTAFKYKGRQEYATFYAEELIKVYGTKLQSLDFDAVIPVPVHRERKRLRGYNQAELIAKELGQALKIPIETKALLRVCPTKPQKGLSSGERQKNLEKAFRFYPDLCRRKNLNRILLVDDIYTTGSTVEACAKSIVRTGVREVYFVALCIGDGS